MTKSDPPRSIMQELWVFETRAAGIYVLIEEIGGQGEIGPFPRMEDARSALVQYLRSNPSLPDLPEDGPPPRVQGPRKPE